MMQASTSKLPMLASTTFSHCLPRQAPSYCYSRTLTSKRASSKAKSKRTPAVPAPNALPLSEAIHTLRSLSPGDTTSAYELTLLPRLASSVNINSLRGRSFLKYEAASSKKKDIILVFAEGEAADQAKREGADIVGGKELVDEILNSTVQPTKIIAHPDFLPVITRSQLPRVLGPKGLMPSAKRGTVTDAIGQAIREARGGLDWLGVEAKARSSALSKKESASRGQVSVPIARISFTDEQIRDNIAQFTREVLDVSNGVGTQAEVNPKAGGKKNKRASIEKAFLTTSKTMSIQLTDVDALVA